MAYCFKTGKLSYSTRSEANGAVVAVNRRRRSVRRNLKAYKCPFCKTWHIGRQSA